MRVFCLLLTLAACGKPPGASPDQIPELVAAAPAAQTLEGTLTYTAPTGAKSVESYLGAEFSLATAAGPVVLGPSAAVPKDTLVALNGKPVTVTCVSRPQAPPDPYSSYPTGAGGQPMARPPVCEVTAVAAK